MRLEWTKNKNSTTYRALQTIRVDGKNRALVIKTFGSDKFICETYGVTNAKAWAKEQVRIMDEADKEEEPSFEVTLHSGSDLPLDARRCFNGGYLFLQQIYYELGLDRICSMIRTRHGFSYNLNSILSRLLYTRILYPSSKLGAYKDSKRFIEQPDFEPHQVYRALTKDGEAAEYTAYYIDEDAIAQEEKYDGFYAVCTSLEDGAEPIIKVNQRRWEIEECFLIMKNEFQARPVYLKLRDRILAHFITCLISLTLYRYLEKKLDNRYTVGQIIDTLREMNFVKYEGKGYQPTYTRTELTDALHEAFGFCTSKEIVPIKKRKKFVPIQRDRKSNVQRQNLEKSHGQ